MEERGVPYRYREYRKDPLTTDEIRSVLASLGTGARDVLRRNDKAYRALGLDGSEDEERLVALMAEHPTLLQRPIGVRDGRAVIGRPPETLLELVEPV